MIEFTQRYQEATAHFIDISFVAHADLQRDNFLPLPIPLADSEGLPSRLNTFSGALMGKAMKYADANQLHTVGYGEMLLQLSACLSSCLHVSSIPLHQISVFGFLAVDMAENTLKELTGRDISIMELLGQPREMVEIINSLEPAERGIFFAVVTAVYTLLVTFMVEDETSIVDALDSMEYLMTRDTQHVEIWEDVSTIIPTADIINPGVLEA